LVRADAAGGDDLGEVLGSESDSAADACVCDLATRHLLTKPALAHAQPPGRLGKVEEVVEVCARRFVSSQTSTRTWRGQSNAFA